MSYRLDLDEIEAAFKRAAHRALHGTREERSGQFLPRKPVDTFIDPQNEPRAASRNRQTGRTDKG
jgi:hypothetical protein